MCVRRAHILFLFSDSGLNNRHSDSDFFLAPSLFPLSLSLFLPHHSSLILCPFTSLSFLCAFMLLIGCASLHDSVNLAHVRTDTL